MNALTIFATLAAPPRHGHDLTPGRYVGAEDVENDGAPFEEKMAAPTATLYARMAEGEKLNAAIRKNLEVLGYAE